MPLVIQYICSLPVSAPSTHQKLILDNMIDHIHKFSNEIEQFGAGIVHALKVSASHIRFLIF